MVMFHCDTKSPESWNLDLNSSCHGPKSPQKLGSIPNKLMIAGRTQTQKLQTSMNCASGCMFALCLYTMCIVRVQLIVPSLVQDCCIPERVTIVGVEGYVLIHDSKLEFDKSTSAPSQNHQRPPCFFNGTRWHHSTPPSLQHGRKSGQSSSQENS